jgi:hypothetical protein
MSRRKLLLALMACVLVVSFISITTLLAAEKTITGTAEKTDAGFIIKTDEGYYTAEGPDLDKWVGKKVEATGDVEGMKITVTEIKEAQ